MTQRTRRPRSRLRLPDWAAWDRAAMTTGVRQVDRPAPGGQYRIPYKVELGEDKIEYWWDEPQEMIYVGPRNWPHQDEGQFSSFVSLGAAPDARILRYARRFGVLRLCQHWRPALHSIGTPSPCRPLGSYTDGN